MYLCRLGRMPAELIHVFLDGNDLGVEITLQCGERLRGILRIPDGRCGHPKDLRTGADRCLEVLAHDSVVCVILAGVVAFVEDYEGDLVRHELAVLLARTRPPAYLVDTPVRVRNEVEEYLGWITHIS